VGPRRLEEIFGSGFDERPCSGFQVIDDLCTCVLIGRASLLSCINFQNCYNVSKLPALPVFVRISPTLVFRGFSFLGLYLLVFLHLFFLSLPFILFASIYLKVYELKKLCFNLYLCLSLWLWLPYKTSTLSLPLQLNWVWITLIQILIVQMVVHCARIWSAVNGEQK